MPDTAIQSLGLFWREDSVFWGAGKKRGKLLGVPATRLTAEPIDFREQIGIYILYDDFRPIYVGQTAGGGQKLLARLKQHRKDDLAGRWNRFSWFGMLRVLGSGDLSAFPRHFNILNQVLLNHMEGILIHAIEPPMNGQSGRFGKKVKRYLQVRDDNLGPEDRKFMELLAKHGTFDPGKLIHKGNKWVVRR